MRGPFLRWCSSTDCARLGSRWDHLSRRVGTALGVALERADHVVVACSAISQASRQRAKSACPTPGVAGTRCREQRGTVAAGGDRHRARQLGGRSGRHVGGAAGTIVVHTSGANGLGVLAPLARQDCIPLASTPR
ncbi:rossmann-like domain protein [Mycobacterium xenopi 3993]|nr:rossmann-like domain protein [Mycobacterium xenopi 3993]